MTEIHNVQLGFTGLQSLKDLLEDVSMGNQEPPPPYDLGWNRYYDYDSDFIPLFNRVLDSTRDDLGFTTKETQLIIGEATDLIFYLNRQILEYPQAYEDHTKQILKLQRLIFLVASQTIDIYAMEEQSNG